MQIMTRVNRGGTAKWLEILAMGLAENGHSNLVVAGFVQGDEVEDALFTNVGGVRVINLGRSVSPLHDFLAFIEIRRLIKEFGPDVVNTHTSKAGVVGRIAAFSILRNKPVIVHTYHGHLLYGYFTGKQVKFIVAIEKSLAKISDLLLVSGERVRDELLREGIGRFAKYKLVNPGVPIPAYDNKLDIRKSLAIKKDDVVVGWLGRFVDIKHPERVIQLAEENPQVKFLMGGDGDLFAQISQLAPENVKLLGWSTPEVIWGAADIAILTSDNEAQPISLVEAGLAGIPSIAFNVGSIDSVISHGATGFLVDDLTQMSLKIGELSTNPAQREELGKNAKHKMLEQYSGQFFVDSHIDAYKSALKEKER